MRRIWCSSMATNIGKREERTERVVTWRSETGGRGGGGGEGGGWGGGGGGGWGGGGGGGGGGGVFFFQAEDGIRDRLVTGVQTCALPIFWSMIVIRFGQSESRDADRIERLRTT